MRVHTGSVMPSRRRAHQAAGRITIRALELSTAELQPQLTSLQQERDAALQQVDVGQFTALAGPEATGRWRAMSVAQCPASLEAIGLESVVLHRRKKHPPGLQPDTIRLMYTQP